MRTTPTIGMRVTAQTEIEEERKMDKHKVLDGLKVFRAMGFEVIKSNSGQTALNTLKNDMPLVINNNVGYTTPYPWKWELISDEITRIEKELQEEIKK